jgi:hypothetical protein
MVHIAQRKFQQFIRQDCARIPEPKQTVISKHGPQSHGTRMLYSLVAQIANASMSVYDFDFLAYNDVTKDGEEGEDGREGGFAVDGPEWDVVGFYAVCEVADAGSPFVCVGNDYYFVAAIYEFLGGFEYEIWEGRRWKGVYACELVHVALHAT